MKIKLSNVRYTADDLKKPYLIASDTNDNGRSTFPECWGAQAQVAAVVIDTADSLEQAKAKACSHDVIIQTSTGREVWRGAKF